MPLRAQQSAVPSSAPSSSSAAQPDNSKALNDKLSDLDKRVTAAQSSGDNAWMLVSAALVLMMTGPGLALFYGGLVRRKNTLAIMMQSFAMMGLITVLWALVGYSLCFGGSGPVIGDFGHAFLRGVGATLALPLLDGMVPAFAGTMDTAAKPAVRLGYIYLPVGRIMDKWTPTVAGESREGDRRVIIAGPLSVKFRVLGDQRRVEVISASYSRGKRP